MVEAKTEVIESVVAPVQKIVPEPGMGKKAIRRQAKADEWQRKKAEMKANGTWNKKKTKKRVETFAHLTRFNELSEYDEDGTTRKLTKQQKQKLFSELCLKGPRIVIDCDFESLMQDKEVKSLAQQLARCGHENKKFKTPMNLIFTGIGEKLHNSLAKSSYENWSVQTYRSTNYVDATPVKSIYNISENSEKIEKSRLVYLTADSDVTLSELDPQDVYIIGGIVDRNRYVNLTLDRAKEQGIRHARLPLGDYVSLKTSAVLAVNHVFEMMGCQYNNLNWAATIAEVIPDRKVKELVGKTVVLGKRTQAQVDVQAGEQEEQKVAEEAVVVGQEGAATANAQND